MGAFSSLVGAASNFASNTKAAVSQFKEQVQKQAKQVQTQVSTAVNTAAVKVRETYEQVVQQYKASSEKDSTCYQNVEQTQSPLQQLENGTLNSQTNACPPPPSCSPVLNEAESQQVNTSVQNIRWANENVTIEKDTQPSYWNPQPSFAAIDNSKSESFLNFLIPTAKASGEEQAMVLPGMLDLSTVIPPQNSDYVKATKSFETALVGQNCRVQNAILAETQGELKSLGEKMPQLQDKAEIEFAMNSFSRTGEALGQENIDNLTAPLAEGMMNGGILDSASKQVAEGMQSSIEGGNGALFSAALYQKFNDKINIQKSDNLSEKQNGLLNITKKFSSAINQGIKNVNTMYESSLDKYKQHSATLEQSISNFPQFTEEEVAAGIEAYRGKHSKDFENFENNSKILASTLEGAAYLSKNYSKTTIIGNDIVVKFGNDNANNIIKNIPELVQSENGYQTLKSSLQKNANQETCLDLAQKFGENDPEYGQKLSYALHLTATRASGELNNLSSKESQLLEIFQGAHQAITDPELKSAYGDAAQHVPEFIAKTVESEQSFLSFASEIEGKLSNQAKINLNKVGAGFSLIAGTANAYQFIKDPNLDSALNLSNNAIDVATVIKPSSRFLGKVNIGLNGAMVASDLAQEEYANAAIGSIPLVAGGICMASPPPVDAAAPLCYAAGAVVSSVIDLGRAGYRIYQNSPKGFEKRSDPFFQGALTEMNKNEIDLNLNKKEIEDAAYELRDINKDFLGAGLGIEAIAQSTGQDSRELMIKLIQQDDKKIRNFVHDTIKALPELKEGQTELILDEEAINTIEESFIKNTSAEAKVYGRMAS